MNTYKKLLLASIPLILLPCFIGLLLWNRLPDQIPTHFQFNGEIDGYSRKPFVVFGIPVLMAAFQVICYVMTFNDPKKQNFSPKILALILGIIPVLSVFICILSYGSALGYAVSPGICTNLMLGLLFIGIGNYLPKVKQNYTMGIKIPWTLNSETNWNKTHRLAGWLWILGGIAFCINAIFLNPYFFIISIVIMTGIPTLYSFVLYKKGI